MNNIKAEIADLIRSKTDDEIFAMISDSCHGGLVTKPVDPQGTRNQRVVRPSEPKAPSGNSYSLVYKAVDGLPGTTITTVSDMTSLPRSEVKKAIAALKDEGKVFQHGERRYTRYATSPTQAERASKLAQNAVKK